MIRACSLDLRLARTRPSSTQAIAISSSRQIPFHLRTQTSSARRINLAYLDCAFATVAKHQPTVDYQTLAWFAQERFLPMHSPHWAPATRELNTGNVEHPHLACSWASAPF